MDTERIIVITVGAIALITSIVAVAISIWQTRSPKGATEIVQAKLTDVQWQDRTEATLKELGLVNARVLAGYQRAFDIAINAALLVDKADGVVLLKSIQSLGSRVLDGQPNLVPMEPPLPIPPTNTSAGVG